MRLFLHVMLIGAANFLLVATAGTRHAQVNRAIEETKSRQMVAPQARAPARAQNSPGRSESIDVDKLNQLIRAVDKTWILPRLGSKEPIGSNFQYKKTCASIFKARHGACQQLGFGVMCFNYCHERGEKLAFRCQDASDAAYCRQSGTFETFLAKYRKDGYKAKAYIHQMISRCYATSICNTQTGILNSTLIGEQVSVETTTKMNRLRLLTRAPATTKPRARTTTTAPDETEYEEVEEEVQTSTTKRRPLKKERTGRPRLTTTTPNLAQVTTSKSNIWDRFTVSQGSKLPSKNIPFWKRLLSTTLATTTSVEEVVEASVEEETSPEPFIETSEETKEPQEQTENYSSESTTPVEDIISTNRPVHKTSGNSGITEMTEKEEERQTAPSEKYTFKPLPMTLPPPQGPELAFQKVGERGPFWNRFQPNRWFESIHYVTNTGK